ncbi:heavy-metal-associated domain-containing protein [Profundibacterium mesophilum]|uniref:Heavy metal binding protein n=1 Tax=Profundibacterium mesophilum KAUST100406-0324 TaxID=1037889 RepID=A0A921NP65_9RHOB|nr:heavy-metal-associated domain-containing protein [Profundibacterium mesophilum]KAF0675756.1 Heavy metal binding protein [Profundibacterium mesophilum KAUST100406-0324]
MTRYQIPGMSCGHCKAAVERAVASVDPTAEVSVDLRERHADVASDAAPARMIEAFKSEGYEAVVAP